MALLIGTTSFLFQKFKKKMWRKNQSNTLYRSSRLSSCFNEIECSNGLVECHTHSPPTETCIRIQTPSAISKSRYRIPFQSEFSFLAPRGPITMFAFFIHFPTKPLHYRLLWKRGGSVAVTTPRSACSWFVPFGQSHFVRSIVKGYS